MILGLLFPGAGHILMNKLSRGINIAITFVILSYVSGILIVTMLPDSRTSRESSVVVLTC
jgi:hypothetical protein